MNDRGPKSRPPWSKLSVKSKNPLTELIDVELKRFYFTPIDGVDYKSITLCFSNGTSLRLDAQFFTDENGMYPVIKLEKAEWEMIEASELSSSGDYPSMPKVKSPREDVKKELG